MLNAVDSGVFAPMSMPIGPDMHKQVFIGGGGAPAAANSRRYPLSDSKRVTRYTFGMT